MIVAELIHALLIIPIKWDWKSSIGIYSVCVPWRGWIRVISVTSERLAGAVSNNSDYIWYGDEKDYVNSNTNSNWYTSSSNTAALSLQLWTTAKPVGTYTFTKIPGYEIKDYNEQVQFKMYQFDTTPTAGSTNPVTSDGISAVLKKKCSIVSEITVAEQTTNLSNPVDRGIYIIKKIDST